MAMYLEHFGLSEAPFKITPHTEFFFAGANRGETLEALMYAITSGEGMVKVTGEVGSGKTMLCRVLMERLPKTVETIYLAVPSISRDEILATIASDLGVTIPSGTTTKLIRALQDRLIELHAAGRQVVALIDEAHAMPLETLEEIRLLSNLETSRDKLMQIVLFGQPELDQHLLLPNMRQLRERITHSFSLLPLPARDIKDYLDFRLRAAGYRGPDLFSKEALRLIAEASEGLTRRINIYADKTLLAAFAAGTHTIGADHVRAAINDTKIVVASSAASQHKWLIPVAGLLVGLAVGFVLGRLSLGDMGVPPKITTPDAPSNPPSPTKMTTPVDKPTAVSTPHNQVGELRPTNPMPSAPTTQPPAGAAPTATAPEPRTSVEASFSALSSAPPIGLGQSDAPAQTSVSRQASVRPAEWLSTRLGEDHAKLKALPEASYVIQLMTADEAAHNAIGDFLRSAGRELDAARVWATPVGTPENPKISVLYGPYPSRSDALAEIARLPTKLRQFRPYARAVSAVRADTRLSPG